MTKGELRTLIKEVLKEELTMKKSSLQEAAQSGRWAIRAWTSIEDRRAGASPIYDSINGNGKSYGSFQGALAALRGKDLAPTGEEGAPSAYEVFYIADASAYNKGKSKVVTTKM